MLEEYDLVVFIGRFQPPHPGHIQVIKEALKYGPTLVLIGGSNVSSNTRNPLSVDDRMNLLYSLNPEFNDELVFVDSLSDFMYNDTMWLAEVRDKINDFFASTPTKTLNNSSVAIIGHRKDNTSYYLDMFPEFDFIDSKTAPVVVNQGQYLSATLLRESVWNNTDLFDKVYAGYPEDAVDLIKSRILEFQDEYKFTQEYKKQWEVAPYPVTFVTVDTLVTFNGKVLLIKRKARPGKGLLAMPGGFIKEDEFLIESAWRELREETKLKISLQEFKQKVVKQKVFDDPTRSQRGRTITTVFHLELGNGANYPIIKGGSDAEDCLWVGLEEIDSSRMFEDHYFIIQDMLGFYRR